MTPSSDPNRPVEILSGTEAVARRAATLFAGTARAALERAGRFTVALAGGSTPERLYALLADEGGSLPWRAIHLFWSDERMVPHDHPASNFRMVRRALLDRIGIPAENVHRVPAGSLSTAQAAHMYEDQLRSFFKAGPGGIPRLDLALLGMGADGHTASLFPGSSALGEHERLVAAVPLEPPSPDRVTMTVPLLRAAARIVFLVTGRGKAEALRQVLQAEVPPEPLPARLIVPDDGDLVWLVDEEAAALLG